MSHIALRAYDTKRRIIPARAKKGKVFFRKLPFYRRFCGHFPYFGTATGRFLGIIFARFSGSYRF
jgi:hypothetical protein